MQQRLAIFGHWSRDFGILLLPGLLFFAISMSFDMGLYASFLSLLIFVGFDSGHAMYTFARMSFIRGEWSLTKRFILAPLLFFLVISVWITLKLPYLFSFIIYYTGWHYMRQHWGILRWYERLESPTKISSPMRKIFLYLAYWLPVLTHHFRVPPIMGVYSDNDFIVFPNAETFSIFQIISLVIFAIWVAYEIRCVFIRKNDWHAPLIYVGQVAIHTGCFLFGKDIWSIFGPTIVVHAISYFALSQRVFSANFPASKKSLYWAVGIVVSLLLLAFPIKLLEDQLMDSEHLTLLQSILLALTITPGLIHYHFDAFLWRRDNPAFAKTMASLTLVIFSMFFISKTAIAETSLSKSVGQVGEHIVTSREVQINTAIESILYQSKTSVQALDLKSKEFEKALNAVLLERMVFAEAEAFKVQDISNSELQAAVKRVDSPLDKAESLKFLAAGNAEVRETVRRKILAKKFIQFKAQSSVVPVTDIEVKEYYQNNKSRFGNADFSQFRESIRSFLSRQQVDERLKSWFEILQSKYKVRNFQSE